MSDVIRVIILSDGKSGHLSGSMGVLKSIERLGSVDHVILQAGLRLKFMRYPLRLLLNHQAFIRLIPERMQRRWMGFFYAIQFPEQFDEAVRSSDWVISYGGDTSFLNAWIAGAYKIKNIYCGSLRGLNSLLFTLLVSIRSGPNKENEIKMTIAPTPVDRVRIREKGRRFREERNLVGDNVWAVLIGGDGAGYHFDGLAMETLADALLALAVRHGARLLVTTSRRTGFKLEETLMKRFHNHPAVIHATFFNHRPEKVMEEFLGSADMVFCTADSGSMITEAIAAGRPVYVWEPVRVEPEAFYQSFLDHLCTARHIKRISSTQLDSVDVNQDKASYFQLLEKEPICEFAEKIKPWFESATEDVICRRPDDA